MSSDLPSWPRPYYQSGGGDAFVFFLAYGTFRASPSISADTYRCNGVPDGLKLARYDRQQHAQWLAGFERGYIWETLRRHHPALADVVAQSPEAMLLQGTVADPHTLDYLRDAVGLMMYFLDHGGVAVLDPQMFHFWDPAQWRERLFAPAAAVPRHHVVILTSDEGAGAALTWFHTRGLRKFGRPDLSLHNVGPAYCDAVIDLLNRFIEFQAFGGVIAEGQEIRVHSLPRGGVARHGGWPDDPDFNNVHVEIAWPDEQALAR